ncbi:MAG: helix-turn-helix transcriptional regulator, partial [Anaerolineales bacterium]|nr:helix-turn-helix transcriptional regulator [Anaerolineales bacterium]
KVWREFRGLSQQDVAERIGISIPYLSQLETGKRRGSFAVLSTLARALGVPLDSLAAQDSE